MKHIPLITGMTGLLAAMTLAVVLAACERRQDTSADQETTAAPSQKIAKQEEPAPQEKAPPAPEKTAQKSSTPAQDDPDIIPEIAMVPFSPGGVPPTTTESAFGRKIMHDPDSIAAGKQLYSAMNCVGCHFHGGGGMGPALMGETKHYGSSIENVAASIREGRPNGMPSFRDRVSDDQIWQLAAYVLSLSKPESSSTGASSGEADPPGSN